jgi:hypothetical protein
MPILPTTGVTAITWGVGGVANSADTSWGPEKRTYRCVAAAVYVQPTGSATSQNGAIYLVESQNHKTVGATFQLLESDLTCRLVRGVQTGDPSIENVVNWHPKFTVTPYPPNVYSDGSFFNDFAFRTPNTQASNPQLDDTHLAVIVEGNVGAVYHYEVFGVYELVGPIVSPLRPRYYDDAGWSSIQNAISTKALSGWVGKPTQAIESYKRAVVTTAADADDLEPEPERTLKKATQSSSSTSSLGDLVKDLAPSLGDIAKVAIGFL